MDLCQILNKIYVPFFPSAPPVPQLHSLRIQALTSYLSPLKNILNKILNKIYVPLISPLFEFTSISLTSYLSPLPSRISLFSPPNAIFPEKYLLFQKIYLSLHQQFPPRLLTMRTTAGLRHY